MRFGVVLGGDPTTAAREAQLLEQRGIDTAWFPEAPLVGYGDPYVCMGLVAQATERIRFGTFISPAAMRPAPSFLIQFGTVARLAPGRVRIGWGSGSFSRGLLGMTRLKVRELREELRVLRGLIDRGEAEIDGAPVSFATWDRPCFDLTNLPLEVAAAGPRTAALAGELADGLITGSETRPQVLSALRDAAIAGAEEAGRPTDDFTFTVDLPALCILRKGETLATPRVVKAQQPVVSSYLSSWVMSEADPDELPHEVRDGFVRFRDWAFEQYGDDIRVVRRRLADRWIGRNPEHDEFITPGAIQGCTLTGPLEEICERLQGIAGAGATDLALSPSLDRELVDDDVLADLVTITETIG